MSISLTLAFPVLASAQVSCFDVFTGQAAWGNPATARLRIEAVVAHQNSLRAKLKLPGVAVSTQQGDSGFKPEGRDLGLWLETPSAFPDEPIAAIFKVRGNDLVREVVNDLYSLNYVYRFVGARLIEARPYALWKIGHFPGSQIHLWRDMSREEFKLWNSKDFARLGSDWGHGSRVVHFSTDKDFTTAATSSSVRVGLRVSKAALTEASRESGGVWAARLGNNRGEDVFEIVVSNALLKSLIDRNAATVELSP